LARNSSGIDKRVAEINALKSASTGTKTIYFDSNDTMYTEDELRDKRV